MKKKSAVVCEGRKRKDESKKRSRQSCKINNSKVIGRQRKKEECPERKEESPNNVLLSFIINLRLLPTCFSVSHLVLLECLHGFVEAEKQIEEDSREREWEKEMFGLQKEKNENTAFHLKMREPSKCIVLELHSSLQ